MERKIEVFNSAKDIVSYVEDNGSCLWSRMYNKPVGSMYKNGWTVTMKGESFRADKVVWHITKGGLLEGDEILHLDGNIFNNCLSNLSVINLKNAELFDLFEYDESSPSCLSWKNSDKLGWNRSFAGSKSTRSNGYGKYWVVRVNGKQTQVHRIIWELFHGKIESDLVVNHINNDSYDNKIKNLEVCTQKQNMRRTKRHNTGVTHGKDLPLGITLRAGYIRARACKDGKEVCRSFSVKDFGFDKAVELGLIARSEMIDELNVLGYGYAQVQTMESV